MSHPSGEGVVARGVAPPVVHQATASGAGVSTRWMVVGLLTAGMAIAYLDRVNLSVAVVDLGAALNLTSTQQGFALSAFFIPYTLLQVPAGCLVDCYGIRRTYAFAFVLWSAASVSTAFVGSFVWLCAMRMLLGVGEAVVIPAGMRYIRAHFDEAHRGMAVGVLMTGSKIGPAIGFPVAALLAASFGWRQMFILSGAVPLLWLLPYLIWVPKGDAAAAPNVRAGGDEGTVSLRAMLASPAMWGTVLGTFSYMYFFYFCLTWMPTYFRQRYDLSLEATGWYAGLSFAGMAVMSVIGGRAADALILRGYDPITVRKAFTVGGLTLATTQTLSLVTGSTTAMMFFSAFGLCALGLASANYWALTQTLIPGGSVGTMVGFQNAAASLAGVVAPWVTGWMIASTGSLDTPIRAIGLWLGLGIASYLLLVRERFAPRADPVPTRRVSPKAPLVTRLDLVYFLYLYPARWAARVMPPPAFLGACRSLIRLTEGAWRGTSDRVGRSMRAAFPSPTDEEIRTWARAAVSGFLNRAAQDLVTRRLIAGGHMGPVTIIGREHLQAAQSEGHGVIVFSSHLLATRLARCYLETQGMPVLATRQGSPPPRRVGRWGRLGLQPAYGRFLHELIGNEVFVEEAGSTLRILRRLREGGIVGALLDGRLARELSIHPLLGVPTAFGVSILDLVRLTRAPLVPVAWTGDWRHLTIEFFPRLEIVNAADRPSLVSVNMPHLVAAIEAQIRRHPCEWEYWVMGWPTARSLDAFGPS